MEGGDCSHRSGTLASQCSAVVVCKSKVSPLLCASVLVTTLPAAHQAFFGFLGIQPVDVNLTQCKYLSEGTALAYRLSYYCLPKVPKVAFRFFRARAPPQTGQP